MNRFLSRFLAWEIAKLIFACGVVAGAIMEAAIFVAMGVGR